MSQAIRQRILEYLKNKPAASAGELSRVLGVGAADIRHHLSILVQQSSIVVVGQRPAYGRGRPALLYALAQPGLPNNLHELADSFLAEMIETLPVEDQLSALRRLAQRMSAGAVSKAQNPTQRLYAAVAHLNTRNYRAHWEARSDAPVIMLGRCPYEAILPQHPILCRLDAFLLEELTGLPAAQLARLFLTPSGLRQCAFSLGYQLKENTGANM
ncbi:MAG TPA: ArsR family transcriptional regulator [Anaerolineales bacterium]|nr:ArsR family transcriptional regulator [Anaerolineales bacterium]